MPMTPLREWVGDVRVDSLSDGSFVARPSYFGPHVRSEMHPEVFDHDGAAVLPIGCFLLCFGDRRVLVDAGLGPTSQSMRDGMSLTGGHLLDDLARCGVIPAEITDVVLTHLHADHVGWLFDESAVAAFPDATLWFGQADWSYFVTGAGEMADHIRAGLLATPPGRLRLLRTDTSIDFNVSAVLTPGHTPGSLAVRVISRGETLWLLGDAITCPVQLTEPDWHSFGDVSPEAAARSRRMLWDELASPSSRGVGAHFPGLVPGHVITNSGQRWQQSERPPASGIGDRRPDAPS